MTAGRHRDPDAAITGPLRRPSRQQLEDRTDRWNRPERRHLTRTDDRPATAWDQAAVPAPVDVDTTGSFSPEDIAAAIGHPLPAALHGADPAATGSLPCWNTGEMPILPAPLATRAPSMRWEWALAATVPMLTLLACLAVMFGGN